jgi:hypothetical protein
MGFFLILDRNRSKNRATIGRGWFCCAGRGLALWYFSVQVEPAKTMTHFRSGGAVGVKFGIASEFAVDEKCVSADAFAVDQ